MSDKESYETYEYLPDGNEVDQFFLVQDDGTFLSLNNRQVQYMTQGQEVKEIVSHVQPCAVYDVTTPQFLIDVNNSAEVISVPDQLMLPNGENIIISNNYLLPVPNTTEEQIVQQDEVMQYQEPDKHINAEEDNGTQKTTDNCTEITLSDEQFHVLEQKGWILLETNDKVYVLDTLGLHDITTNDKLIQKLKSSEGSECIQEVTSLSSQQDEIRLDIGEDGVKLSEDIIEEHDPFLMDSSHNEHAESMEISSLDTNETLDTKVEMASIENNLNITDNIIPQSNATESIFDTKQEENTFEEMQNVNNENVDSKLKDVLKSSKTKNIIFKVNTNIAFKDIPNKIALGETKSGKKLFAKITNLSSIDLPKKQCSSRYVKRILRNKTDCNNTAKETKETKEKKLIDSVSVDEKVFEALVRQAAREGAQVRCSAQDISSAHATLMQLLKIPDFNTLVFDRNLIITKMVSEQEEQGTYSSGGLPSLVTGRITTHSGRYCFLHLPDMLHNIIHKTEDYKPDIKKGDIAAVNFDDNNILHVHVNEMKRADNVLRVSITLNTRKIPIEATSEDSKRKLASKAFACRDCATIFNTEDDLKQHQQTQCLDVDGDLSIDLDKKVAGYTTVIENGKDKMYHCNQCRMQFVKLHNCLKHLKTHYKCETMDDTDSSQPGSMKGIHKCKMCPCTFNHQQTLVKHIVNKHINV